MDKIIKISMCIFVLGLSYLQAQNTVSSPHGDKLKLSCETCHTTLNWNEVKSQSFDHEQVGYPLLGEHNYAECSSCHISLIFTEVASSCIDCHTDLHKGELGNHCGFCHNSINWENRLQVSEQHNQTNFPLIGVHANLDCESCHINEQQRQYINLSVECQSCHLTDYMNTLGPSHQEAGFDLDCQKCHLPIAKSWGSVAFGHTESDFPLLGAHKTIDCAACHINGFTEKLPIDCWSCHEKDFISAVDPNHLSNNFDHECVFCHNSVAWSPADFDHIGTQFPLTGAHKSVNCMDCHSAGFVNTPTNCFACHEQDYNDAIEPKHQTANFPNTCEDCHTPKAWTPADWDHDNQYFPIYSGKHRGEWDNCIDCHVNPEDYKQFECINCHEHRQSKMDNEHDDERDYVWESHACYSCHPDGDD